MKTKRADDAGPAVPDPGRHSEEGIVGRDQAAPADDRAGRLGAPGWQPFDVIEKEKPK